MLSWHGMDLERLGVFDVMFCRVETDVEGDVGHAYSWLFGVRIVL